MRVRYRPTRREAIEKSGRGAGDAAASVAASVSGSIFSTPQADSFHGPHKQLATRLIVRGCGRGVKVDKVIHLSFPMPPAAPRSPSPLCLDTLSGSFPLFPYTHQHRLIRLVMAIYVVIQVACRALYILLSGLFVFILRSTSMPRVAQPLLRHPCGAINAIGYPVNRSVDKCQLSFCDECGEVFIRHELGRPRLFCGDRCRKRSSRRGGG